MPCIIGACMFMNCDQTSGFIALPSYRFFDWSASFA